MSNSGRAHETPGIRCDFVKRFRVAAPKGGSSVRFHLFDVRKAMPDAFPDRRRSDAPKRLHYIDA
jgi:hypothetical protein